MQVLKGFHSNGVTYRPGDTFKIDSADPQFGDWLTRKGFICEMGAGPAPDGKAPDGEKPVASAAQAPPAPLAPAETKPQRRAVKETAKHAEV